MSSGGGSSSRSGRGGGGNNNGVPSIPSSSKKLVQSLKEIVNFPEHEIYAMLKECNMDPDETAQKLLSQDSFHEVKSKREKKKETKETSETRPRGVSYPSNRGTRAGTDYNTGRGSSTPFSSTESGIISGKPALKKELRSHAFPSSTTPASVMAETSGWSSSLSHTVAPGSRTQTSATSDGISLFPKLSPGGQSAWLGVPGQLSMADVVKMGRPQHKASRASIMSTETSYSPHTAIASVASHDLHSYPNSSSKFLETIHEPDIVASQHAYAEWPMVEKLPAASGSSFLEPTAVSEFYADRDQLNAHRANQNLASRLEEVQVAEEASTVENLNLDSSASASASSNLVQESNSGSQSHFADDSYNISSYQSHRPAFDHQEGIAGCSKLSTPNYSKKDVSITVSSAIANLEQLHLREELGVPPAEDNPGVRIPNHLQVPSANCSHLSFGSFGYGVSATVPVPFASPSLKNNLEEAFVVDDASAVGHYDSRHQEQYRDVIRSTPDGNSPRTGAGAGSYNSSSTSHPDVMKHDNAGAAREHQYTFPSSVHGYTFEDNSKLNASLSYSPSNAQMQNLAPFPTAVQSFTDSLPSNFMSSTVKPARDSDIPYSSFPATQTLPTMYNTPTSSISGSAISMSESGNPGVYSMPQPMQQNLHSTNIVTGPSISQQLTADHHPYSQQTLPLGNYANMVGYPFVPQNFTYVPSTFQQAYAGSSAYNQSPTALQDNPGINYTLPPYKNSGSLSSFPQSAAAASGYGGGFGNMANTPGSFLLNRLSTPEMATISLDDLLRSQYKDANNLAMPIQNESSAMWVHGGPGASRATGSVLPASAYYNLLGTNQQHNTGLRAGGQQQPSHHHGGGQQQPSQHHGGGQQQSSQHHGGGQQQSSQHHGGGQQQPSQHHGGGQQQPSQHHGGGLGGGYPNIYHSHSQTGGGVLQEHHLQMSSDGTQHSGLQGQPSNQQPHQLWRHNY